MKPGLPACEVYLSSGFCHVRRRFCSAPQTQTRDSLVICIEDFNFQPAKAEVLTSARHAPFLGDYKAGNGGEIVVGDLHAEQPFNLANLDTALHIINTFAGRSDLLKSGA